MQKVLISYSRGGVWAIMTLVTLMQIAVMVGLYPLRFKHHGPEWLTWDSVSILLPIIGSMTINAAFAYNRLRNSNRKGAAMAYAISGGFGFAILGILVWAEIVFNIWGS